MSGVTAILGCNVCGVLVPNPDNLDCTSTAWDRLMDREPTFRNGWYDGIHGLWQVVAGKPVRAVCPKHLEATNMSMAEIMDRQVFRELDAAARNLNLKPV